MSELTEAIAVLQSAQADLVAARKTIVDHNIDLEAHADIREALTRLIEGEAIYTRSEIKKLIADGLAAHVATAFDKAHAGWGDYNTALQTTLNGLIAKVDALEKRLDAAAGTENMTELEKQLQAVEDKYAPILSNLQESFSAAEKANQTVLAEECKSSIAKTLDEKKNELLAVMTAWQTTHSA